MSFWRHFYLAERTGQGLAQAMLYFWRRYEWDFLKVNPRATYQAEAWGVKPTYGPDEHTKEELGEWPVKEASDWARIVPVSPTEGVFAEQLDALAVNSDPRPRLVLGPGHHPRRPGRGNRDPGHLR